MRWTSRSALLVLALCLGCGDDDGGAGKDGGGAGGSANLDASDTPPSPAEDGGREGDAEVPDAMDASTAVDGGPGDSGAHDADAPDDDDDAGDPSDDDPDPDYAELDSDDDGISDEDEGRSEDRDSDGDGTDDYLDQDSDDDCRSDAIESDVDTDLDGAADARDLDSDGDYVTDEQEDVDCDGARQGGETSALVADTDEDGATDLIERVLGTDGIDELDHPAANGDLVFLSPYQAAAVPAQGGGEVATEVTQLDVFILMDTTGSMGGELTNLQTAFSGSLVSIAGVVSDVAVGVGGYEDFADTMTCYGSVALGDRPFYLLHRVMTVQSTSGRTSIQNALDALVLHNGGDLPESGWQALYQVAVGSALTYNGVTVPAFDTAIAYPTPFVTGESGGSLGGVGFRSGALRTVVMITDASSHNSDSYGGAENLYGYGTCPAVPVAATKAQAITALQTLGVRVIGVAAAGGSADAKPDLMGAVVATGAEVVPAAWDVDVRPAGCSSAQCCTGLNGVGVAASGGGTCPLVYDVASNGTGLGSSLVDGLAGLLRFGRATIGAVVVDADGGDSVDPASAFVDRIAAINTAGGACEGLTTEDSQGGGTPDRFVALQYGTPACFDVVAKSNTTVAATADAQVFEATLSAAGTDGERLGTRRVYFVVPPEIEPL